MSNDAETNRAFTEYLAEAFKSFDWLVPAYLTLGFLSKFAQAIKEETSETRLQIVETTLAQVYSPAYLAVMLLERYSKIIHVRDFKQQIDEAIKVYFSGYKLVAIASMIPVLEGKISKIATRQRRDVGRGIQKLDYEFEALVEREKSSTNCYGSV